MKNAANHIGAACLCCCFAVLREALDEGALLGVCVEGFHSACSVFFAEHVRVVRLQMVSNVPKHRLTYGQLGVLDRAKRSQGVDRLRYPRLRLRRHGFGGVVHCSTQPPPA